MILIDDNLSISSTATFIDELSTLVDGGISHNVQQLVLKFMIDFFPCPLCQAPAGAMCYTFGAQNLRRTHPSRLESTEAQRRLAISWAELEHRRRIMEDRG